jgi:ABC-type bacteriocin/lantibiotic exporter with double-glycine peptidase domain
VFRFDLVKSRQSGRVSPLDNSDQPDLNVEMDSELRWLLAQMRKHLRLQLLSSSCLFLNAILLLAEPLLVKFVIDDLIPQHNERVLIVTCFVFFIAAAGRLSLGAAATRYFYFVNQKFVVGLRMKLLRHFNQLSANYHEQSPVGSNAFLIQEAVNELGELSTDLLGMYLRTAVLFIGTLATMFYLNFRLGLTVLPLLGLFVATVVHKTKGLQSASDSVQAESVKASNFLQEHLSSVIQVQLLTRERFQALRAFRVWARLAKATKYRNYAEITSGLYSSVIVVAGEASILGYGSLQVIHGTLTVGGLIAFYRCMSRLFDPLYFSIDLNTKFQRAAATVRQVRGLLQTEPSVNSGSHTVELNQVNSVVSMQGITFGYRTDQAVIRDISLTIEFGERIALVGPSGSGKSTIAKLLSRLYDISSGAVSINNKDVREITLESLRTYVDYVPQHISLFDGSLEENLQFANPRASRDEVLAIAEMAGLLPLMAKLQDTNRKSIGPNGGLLSGGERQLVGIARAMLRASPLVILDEATAELDSVVESKVLSSVDRHLTESTIVIINHRLPSITWVDRIILLDKGKIVGIGKHETLYRSNALYFDLFNRMSS